MIFLNFIILKTILFIVLIILKIIIFPLLAKQEVWLTSSPRLSYNVLQVNDVLDFAKKRVSRASKIQNVAQPEAPKARSVYLLLYAGRI